MAKWYNEFLESDQPHHNGSWGGRQKIYKFPNGYGASVIPEYIEREVDEYEDHENPERPVLGDMMPKKGFWEVAVFKDGELCYDTEITDDVMRHLNDPDVDNILGQIKNLME
jgi:hypothetical protein